MTYQSFETISQSDFTEVRTPLDIIWYSPVSVWLTLCATGICSVKVPSTLLAENFKSLARSFGMLILPRLITAAFEQ